MSTHRAHDVEAAAEDYFSRHVSQLTREELEHEVQVRRNVNGADHSCQLLASRLIAAEHERNHLGSRLGVLQVRLNEIAMALGMRERIEDSDAMAMRVVKQSEENHRLMNQVDSQWRQNQEQKRVLEAVWRQLGFLGFEPNLPGLERCVFDRIAHLMRCESVLRAVSATVKEATP